jgi:hypothetical protein
VSATGGNGGSTAASAGAGGTGGNASAQIDLTGAAAVTVFATANGGVGATGSTLGTTITYGNATATAAATSSGGGLAQATATGTGGNSPGTITATATSNNSASGAVVSVRASGATRLPSAANANPPPTETLHSFGSASIAGSFSGFDQVADNPNSNAGTVITGAPSAADVSNAIGTSHPNVTAAFDASNEVDYLALVAQGGDNITSGTQNGTQELTSSSLLTLDVAQLAHGAEMLEIGLLDPDPEGNGFSSLHFQLQVNGMTVVDQTFTDEATANAYFSDDVLNLGPLSGTTATLSTLLDVTTASAGDGYNVDFVVANAVPEPSSWALLGGGVLVLMRRRKRGGRRARGSTL